MDPIEGVDYSKTPNANWTAVAEALTARGKQFAGRYAVSDKSPDGRGISAAEYQAFSAANVDTFVYWEASTSWMLGGWDAGVRAARNAQANLIAAGMPASMPVYFAHDIDPEPQHFDEIDACLQGAASVIGADRVGIYGGWLIIDHCWRVGTARWFCLTVAWLYGRGVHPSAHLYQYDTRNPALAPQNSIAGIDCDMVRALQPIYGQASAFVSGPPIEPHVPVVKVAPIWWEKGDIGPQERADGAMALAFVGEITAKKGGVLRATVGGKKVGTFKTGESLTAVGSYVGGKGIRWYVVERDGEYPRVRYSSFVERFPTL